MTLTSQVSATFDYPAPLDLFHAWYRVRYYSSQINTKKWHLSKVFFPMVIPSLDTFALNQSGVSLLNILLITRFLVLLFAMKYFMIYYLIYIFHQPLKHLQHKCFVLPCCVFSNEREADHLFSHFNLFKIKVVSFK